MGDVNGDGVFDTILDAELAGFIALEQDLINRGLGAAGVAVDPSGGLWVSDASSNHLIHFNLPLAPLPSQVQPPSNSQQQIGPQSSSPTPTATGQ